MARLVLRRLALRRQRHVWHLPTTANEIAISNNSTFNAKFTTSGFQVGSGTAAAQLHIFGSDTTDQVIIENSDAGP